jgi:hypothetical protein
MVQERPNDPLFAILQESTDLIGTTLEQMEWAEIDAPPFETAVAAGVMTGNADNASVHTTDNSMNPLAVITGWGEFRMSAAMESVLQGYDDPRIGEYFDPAADARGFRGLRNGQTPVNRNSTVMSSTRTISAVFPSVCSQPGGAGVSSSFRSTASW